MKKKIKIFAVISVVGATVAWLAPMPYNLLGWFAVVISAAAIFDILE